MKAVVIGATGATGSDLLKLLLQDTRFDEVTILVRHNPGVSHSKLKTYIVNFDYEDTWQHLVAGDVLFSCLGTTLKEAGDKAGQWKIDYSYQLKVAEAAKANGVSHCIIISSVGADEKSPLFYLRMKGQLDEAIKQLHFTKTTILKPPALIREYTDRLGEKVMLKALGIFNKMGLMKERRPMPTSVVAQAMLTASIIQAPGAVTWEADDIWRAGQK
ncbi:MAG: NAD(P)H-binding protein [Veillonella sp.]|uniref:NAD(P)H-binding protein n=1 Tax=Veillonella sp. TaxID=1926307 RepID=UPI0025F5E5BC|nr:NAD(P)H-binding protein [Veillonella sp.]MBS4913301.1 NAD(P)H-binding protein [Veillonella sp.]